ncbi:MAG: phosphoribosylamine--glycine ligase [Deltaproteobacteria bacterium]|nr:phosphoribosylamine--glycine ligase [Deltaproteobacteria bacterium]
MKMLIIGEGGRESAICRALMTANPAPELIIAPGNAGTAHFGKNHNIAVKDIDGLVALAQKEHVDFVIVGGETSLVLGITDRLKAVGIACAGPSQQAAQLEGSKIYTRNLARDVNVPSPSFVVTRREAELAWAMDAWEGVPVVKADGLASGKGVFLPDTKAEALSIGNELLHGKLGDAGREIVLEERLTGIEASFFYACDGVHALPLPNAKDHKRIGDKDTGPNTGGMGAISPNPVVTIEIEERVRDEIVIPILAELEKRGTPFVGFLYTGVMITETGPKLIEFNVRLGDPEAQAILPRLPAGSFLSLCKGIAFGELGGLSFEIEPWCTCALVLSAKGYPDKPQIGDPITIESQCENTFRWIDFAGVTQRDETIVTNGGRVLAIVGRGTTPTAARSAAYAGVQYIAFEGMHYRRDIGREQS